MLTTRGGPGLPGELSHDHGAPALGSLSLPVCPFARDGFGSRRMASCRGYAPHRVSFTGVGAGESLGERVTCTHLGTQRGGRGYVSACRHPGGPPAN